MLLTSCQTLIPRGSMRGSGKGRLYLGIGKSSESSLIRILNLDDYSFEEIEIPLTLPHSLFLNKTNPDEVYLFEMLGSAAKVNFRSKEVSLIDHRKMKGNLFVGHAIQTETEKGILCLEYLPDFQVVVRARSAKDLSLIDLDFSNFPVGHHIVRLPGTSIAVSSGKNIKTETNHITFYDFQKHEVLSHVESKERLAHLMAISSSEVIGVSLNIKFDYDSLKTIQAGSTAAENLGRLLKSETYVGPSPMYYAHVDGTLKTHWDENRKDLFGWGFGVDRIPGHDQLYVTGHYHSGTVVLWRNFEVQGIIHVPAPLGIVASADGSEFLVLSEGKIKVYSTEKLSLVKEIAYEKPVNIIYRYG